MSEKTSSKKKESAKGEGVKSGNDAQFDPQSLIGEPLDDRYEIEACIGRGGMGVVYLASQSALDRKVVIKVLPPTFVDDEEASARFEREARGMSKLQHPHIVSIYDFGYRGDQAYIVMEYVEGITLRRLIKSNESIDFSTFGAIALQILEGISEAHSLGLVHRDIKPSNIMLTERRGERNYVKILDFGLAKLVKGATDVTKEQNLVGSVAFLAPEQIMGNDTDERVDVYALGVLFYFMLTGEKPFVGDDDVAVLYQHVHNEPDRLDERLPAGHDIPQSILDLIHRALSKDPEDRPHNAGQFLFEFGACIDGTDISSPHVSGEFNTASRVARLSNLSPDDPSDQLSRQRRETPIHHLPADATPSHHSGLVALGADPSSGQVTWVSGEHLLKVEKQNRLRNIMLGVLGVLLIGGVAFYFYTQQAGVPSQDKVRADIAQAVTLIEDGKLGQAEGALEMVERDLQHYPDLKGDFVAAEDRLEIAQLMAEAGLFAEEGDLQEAIDAYKQVLSRNPNHERARSRKHAVRERLAASKPEASEEAQAESAEPADDSADQPEADLEVAKDEAPSPTPTPERSGAKAPQRTESAGAAKPTRSSGAKPKPAATKENAEKPAKASQTVEKQKVAKEKQQDKDSSDDSVLLPSDKAADSDDPTGGDLLPADDGSGGGDLLLD